MRCGGASGDGTGPDLRPGGLNAPQRSLWPLAGLVRTIPGGILGGMDAETREIWYAYGWATCLIPVDPEQPESVPAGQAGEPRSSVPRGTEGTESPVSGGKIFVAG